MDKQSLLSLKALKKFAAAVTARANPDDIDSFDPDLVRMLSPVIDRAARIYFRMEVEGIDRVPPGKALLVGNHNAGITYLEPIGFGARWYLERGMDDSLHFLVHDAMVAIPGLNGFLVRAGCVRASHETATELLQRGKKVMVFPGGNLEAFRPYRDRYKIVFGGKKGFVRLALRQQVPIVPVVIVGGHESFFILHDGRGLAKLLRLKKLLRSETCALFIGLPWGIGFGPIFHLPLPTKSTVRFLEPVALNGYGPDDAENPKALEEIYQKVTGRMQEAVDEISARRRWPVFG